MIRMVFDALGRHVRGIDSTLPSCRSIWFSSTYLGDMYAKSTRPEYVSIILEFFDTIWKYVYDFR
jgi:hypothetical protein